MTRLEEEILSVAEMTDDPSLDHWANRVELDRGIATIVEQVRQLEERYWRALDLLRGIGENVNNLTSDHMRLREAQRIVAFLKEIDEYPRST